MYFNFGPKDIIGIIRRRFFWGAIPFLLIAIAGLVYVKRMPPIYESTTTFLVEDQQIRDDFVQSAVQSDAYQRIEAISARVQARDNLLAIADTLNLYQNAEMSPTQRFEAMQRDTTITIRRTGARSNRPDDASTIIVRIAYRSPNPTVAQRVTNALLTDFGNRSVDLRTEVATETSDFLREEELKIQRRLAEVSAQINDIKQEFVDSLPENRTIYERALDRTSAELSRVENGISEADQNLKLLELQRPLLMRNEEPASPLENELTSKRRQLEALQLEYQDSYPDVVSLKRDVLALERDLDPASFRQRASREIGRLKDVLATTDRNGPAYARIQAEISGLERQMRDLPAPPPSSSLSELQYDAQVQAVRSRRASLEAQRDELSSRVTDLENQIAATPVVAGQLFGLEEARDQLQADLSELRTKLADAERSESSERLGKSERLTTLEQPTTPDQPVSPDKPRLAILIAGAAGLAAGLCMLVPEILFARIRSRDHLERILPDTAIIEVPRFGSTIGSLPQRAGLIGLVVVTGGLIITLGTMAASTILGL